jgi:hypothetical protein
MEDYEELYGAGNEMNQAAGPFISRPNLQLLLQTNSRVSPVPPRESLAGHSSDDYTSQVRYALRFFFAHLFELQYGLDYPRLYSRSNW